MSRHAKTPQVPAPPGAFAYQQIYGMKLHNIAEDFDEYEDLPSKDETEGGECIHCGSPGSEHRGGYPKERCVMCGSWFCGQACGQPWVLELTPAQITRNPGILELYKEQLDKLPEGALEEILEVTREDPDDEDDIFEIDIVEVCAYCDGPKGYVKGGKYS